MKSSPWRQLAGLAGWPNGAAGSLVDGTHVRAGIGSNSRIAVGGDGSWIRADGERQCHTRHPGRCVGRRRQGCRVACRSAPRSRWPRWSSTSATVGQGVVFDAGSSLTVVPAVGGQHRQTKVHRLGRAHWQSVNAGLSGARTTPRSTPASATTPCCPMAAWPCTPRTAAPVGRHLGITVGGVLAVGANTAKALTNASSLVVLGNVRPRPAAWAIWTWRQPARLRPRQGGAGGGGLVSGQAATAWRTTTRRPASWSRPQA